MDFNKDNTRNPGQAHFCESNAGHLSVQTTSPFKMKMRDSEFKADQKMKSKKEKNINVISKKLPHEACSSVTSKLLVSQIIKDNNIDGVTKDGITEDYRKTDEKSNYSQNFTIKHIKFKRSVPIFNYKSSSMHLGLCPKEESLVEAEVQNKSSEKQIRTSDSTKSYAEKTTYCRPNMSWNHEFINKTLEKNARLQKIVKRLICARKKEKEVEAWNNYINELKNKHEPYHNNQNYLCYSDHNVEYVKDYHAESECQDSYTCNELLRDFYLASEETGSNLNYVLPTSCKQTVIFENQSDCYPMSSQGRFMMLCKERKKNPITQDWPYPLVNRPFYGHTIVVDRENEREKLSKKKTKTSSTKSTKENKYAVGVTQTFSDELVTKSIDYTKEEKKISDAFKEQYEKISHNVDRLKRRLQDTVKTNGPGVLTGIENKLDTLISSLNTFIQEVKCSSKDKQSYNCHCLSLNRHNCKMNASRSETFGLVKTEKLVCGLLTQTRTKPTQYNERESDHRDIFKMNINRILSEEINNSKKAKEDIEDILSGNIPHSCSVQISLDIPIKEQSTEVTDSFSNAVLLKDKSVSVAKLVQDAHIGDKKMNIAVNTDPLGLLALLRISTETMKQFLSYMPNIPYYYSYLSMLHTPQLRMHSDYICNICGAAFGRPSQLSDHIQSHELGKTRDCCVCRHILDMQSQKPPGLFRCQYCGQRFTRAYCCELHQESCAKRFGLKHDVKPSLMILR